MSDRCVATASPIGMLTRPKLIDPFQMVRMSPLKSSGTSPVLPANGLPFRTKLRVRLTTQTTVSEATAEPAASRRTIARLWLGAVGAPVYATSSPRDCTYVPRHSDAVGVLAENEEQRAKLEGVELGHVLTFADLDDLRARGRKHAAAHPEALAHAAAAVGEDDLFTYIYTSGTTGPPKACMIRHRNYHDMVASALAIEGWAQAGDLMLLYLPLAHNFGRLMHLQNARAGMTTAFCPDPYRVREALKDVRPTILPSVPRVYEKIHTTVVARFDELSGVRRRLVDWALDVGRRASPPRQRGEPLRGRLALEHRVAGPVRFSTGQRGRGAP